MNQVVPTLSFEMDLLLNSSASNPKERGDSKSTARSKGTCFVSIVFDLKKDGMNDFHCNNCCVFGIDQHEYETIKGLLTKNDITCQNDLTYLFLNNVTQLSPLPYQEYNRHLASFFFLI